MTTINHEFQAPTEQFGVARFIAVAHHIWQPTIVARMAHKLELAWLKCKQMSSIPKPPRPLPLPLAMSPLSKWAMDEKDWKRLTHFN